MISNANVLFTILGDTLLHALTKRNVNNVRLIKFYLSLILREILVFASRRKFEDLLNHKKINIDILIHEKSKIGKDKEGEGTLAP